MNLENSLLAKVKKSFIQMFTGESVGFLSAFLSGYFFALFLGPNDYGIWQTAKVFISYSIVFTFSLPFVMRRDFVMLKSDGRHEEAQRIADLVFTYELFVTPILSLSLISYAFFFINIFLLKLSVIAVGLIYISQFVGGYSNILAKGLNNYTLIRKASIINGVLTLLSIPFVYFYGIKALLISAILIALLNSVYYYINRPFNYKVFWDNNLFKSLLIISFPLYLQDISTTIFDSIDRLIIAKYLDFKQVGYYSLASLAIVPLRLAISSLSLVLFTQLNEKYGFSKDNKVVEKHVFIPHYTLSLIIPPLIGISVIILPFFVSLFLPKYVNGVTSAQISLFATFIYLLNNFSANALFIVDKQKTTALIFLAVGIIKTILCVLSIYLGFGIIGVSVSTLIAFSLLDFLMLTVVFKHLGKSKKEVMVYFVKELSPIIWIGINCFTIIYIITPYLDSIYQLNSIYLLLMSLGFIIIMSLPLYVKSYKYVKEILRTK